MVWLSWLSAERPGEGMGMLPVESGLAVAFARQVAAANDQAVLRAELDEKCSRGLSPFPSPEAFAVHVFTAAGERGLIWARWTRSSTRARRVAHGSGPRIGYRG